MHWIEVHTLEFIINARYDCKPIWLCKCLYTFHCSMIASPQITKLPIEVDAADY